MKIDRNNVVWNREKDRDDVEWIVGVYSIAAYDFTAKVPSIAHGTNRCMEVICMKIEKMVEQQLESDSAFVPGSATRQRTKSGEDRKKPGPKAKTS